ncbi:hypothetical protein ABZW30_42350 [Kitasatospora sp. NPDC004669]|uniref:hypothetical protein n=1 Tax=Kitasatospora sp. NPDC004669 TaxID=3154555 RepID=UPI0033A779C2
MKDDVTEHLRATTHHLDNFLAWYEPLRESHWRVPPGSSLAGDDAKTDPYQVSHAAQHAIQTAVDHLHCLRSSLVQHENTGQMTLLLHSYGSFTLLRGALENSARAVWLLAPAGRYERIRRRLALQNADNTNHHNLQTVAATANVLRPAAADPEQPALRSEKDKHQDLVDRLLAAGGPQNDPKKLKEALRFPGYGEVVREAGRRLPQKLRNSADERIDTATYLEWVWKACSALAHGDLKGSLAQLNRKVQATDGDLISLRLTGPVTELRTRTELTCRTVSTALDLYAERSQPPH